MSARPAPAFSFAAEAPAGAASRTSATAHAQARVACVLLLIGSGPWPDPRDGIGRSSTRRRFRQPTTGKSGVGSAPYILIVARAEARYICQECGQVSLTWTGKCPGCGEWNTLVEARQRSDRGRSRPAAAAP